MTTADSCRQLLVRAVNHGGRLIQGRQLKSLAFDKERLLAEAIRQAGYDDFGPQHFLEPFSLLLESYENEARLNLTGRIAIRHDTQHRLVNRLRIEADRKRFPAICQERISKPIFIAGLPRTGTTLLYNLLAQDPANRTPLGWQVMYPSPPPALAAKQNDPRMDAAQRRMNWLNWLAPSFKVMHPLSAVLPQECIALSSLSFESFLFQTICHVPTYQRWLEQQDMLRSYEYHHRFLQQLQFCSPGVRWILKAPAHLFAFDAILKVYPDARIVQTHRTPLKVLPSVSSLTLTLRRAFSDNCDPEATGREIVQRWSDGLQRALTTRRTVADADSRFYDIHYRELVQNPIGSVERLYNHFGLTLKENSRNRMQAFLKQHPQNSHGRHNYSLAQFRINPEVEIERFRNYCDAFRIVPEP